MLEDIKLGMNGYFDALGFVLRNRLWHYFLYPILLSIIAFVVFLAVKAELIEWIMGHLRGFTGFDETQDDLSGWMGKIISFFVTVMIWIVGTYIFWTFNKYIVLIVLSPVLAILSERTESILTGKKYPIDLGQFVSDIIRGIVIAIRNMLIEFAILLALSLSALIFPIMSPLIIVVLFIVSAYFYGFSMFDYNNERHRLTIGQGTRLIQKNRILAVANGAFFDLLMRIPLLGVAVAPVLGCVGATLALHKKYDLNKNLKSQLT